MGTQAAVFTDAASSAGWAESVLNHAHALLTTTTGPRRSAVCSKAYQLARWRGASSYGRPADSICRDSCEPPSPKLCPPAPVPEQRKQHHERQRAQRVKMDRLRPMALRQSAERPRDSAQRAWPPGEPMERAQAQDRLIRRREPPEERHQNGGADERLGFLREPRWSADQIQRSPCTPP